MNKVPGLSLISQSLLDLKENLIEKILIELQGAVYRSDQSEENDDRDDEEVYYFNNLLI